MSKLERAGVAGLLAFAALLRLGWPGVNLFDFDQAQVSLIALRLARRGEWAVAGMPSSAGVPNFPAAGWIYAIPYRLSTDPLLASLFTGVLGVLAVVGIGWLVRQAWGPLPAFVAGGLFAASPYAVIYSRDIWSQDLLPPLAVAWAVCGVLAVKRGSRAALVVHSFIATFAFQVHYAGLALIPASLVLGLWARWWRRWPWVLLGGALALAAATPFLYDLSCCAPAVRDGLAKVLDAAPSLDLSALRQTAQMGVGGDWDWRLLGPEWSWPGWFDALLLASRVVVGAVMAIGILVLGRDAWAAIRRGPGEASFRDIGSVVVIAWAAATSVTFLRHTTPVLHQYQLASLPALFCLAGAAIGRLRRGAWAATAILATAALAQSAATMTALTVAGRTATPGGMGTPLAWPRAAARALSDGGRIVVHAYGDEPAFVGDVAGFDVLFWDYPHQAVDGRSALLIPAYSPGDPEARLLFTFPDLPAVGELATGGLGGETQKLPRREGDPPYLAFTPADSAPFGFIAVNPLTLANGARLLGWRTGPSDGGFRFATWWEIVGQPTGAAYHLFNHLCAGECAEMIAGADVTASSRAWRTGDTLIVWADLPAPDGDGPFFMDIGMYDYPGMERSPIVERPDDPSRSIRLGPFQP